MIVVSLLLILVAVILLVLGLAGGSSGLLISSIVASLLAAVALVVGARQAAAGRRAVGEPLTADPDDIQPAEPFAGPGRRRPAEPDPAEAFLAAQSRTSAASGRPAAADPADGDLYGEPPGDVRTDEEPSGDRLDDGFDNHHDEETRTATGRDAAYAAGQRDTEAALTGTSGAATGPDVTQRIEPDTEPAGTPGDAGADHVPYSGTDTDRTATRAPQGADYDQASSVIGGARAEDDDSWRRAPGEEAETDGDRGRTGAPVGSEPARGFGSEPAAGFGSAADSGSATGSFEPAAGGFGSEPAEGFGSASDSGAVAGSGAAAGEFGEPDPDDPDDEPPPQRVRPADAVRVARMDAEVVVVDGRPRYHLADCPHLPGRSTEALPVAEAVELGFSPCGLCRPVDRLVAAATRS
ncbi:hypothetical protein ACPCHT_12235 [Nucisporomicrobium flavum]|uniref:hypothetical protein n=1 Tax=Nucisporomicrobium flavum TaxID=2785915 RepID=UPI003C2C6A3F